MAIDPSIILGIKPASFKMADPMETAQRSLTLQNLLGQQDMQAMQMRQAQQGEADDMATREAYKAGGGDVSKVLAALQGSGNYKAAQALQDKILANKKNQGDIDKTSIEVESAKAKQGRDLIATANPQNYPAIIAEGRRLGQKWADNAPPEFDPNWQRQNVIKADDFLKTYTPNITAVQDGGVTRMIDQNTFTNPNITKQTFSRANPGQDLVMPDATGAYKVNQPLLNAKSQVANAGAARTVVNMADGQKGFDNELKLRGDFRQEPVYKAHQEMQSAYSQIQQALKQASPAGDLAGATKIMKLLDPGSVVRESELGMAMQASGLMDRLQNYATNVMAGTKLTPTQRIDFNKLASALYSESVKQYNNKRDEYSGLATNYGLNPERVSGKPSAMPAAPKVDPSTMSDKELLKSLGINQ